MKTMIAFCLVLLVALVTSFTAEVNNSAKVKITVTASSPTTFDMLQNDKTVKGLSTPFEVKVSGIENKFIFKSSDFKSVLKINIERGDDEKISTDWPVTVVLIDDEKISSFGMF